MREGTEEKKIFKEIMAENLPNLLKSSNLHIQEARQTSNKINIQREPQTSASYQEW